MNTTTTSTLTIRSVDAALKNRLRVVAAAHGRSMEEEVRVILRNVLAQPVGSSGLGSRVHARFAALGGLDLAAPERVEQARAASFDQADSAT
jgi:plasmid stability protein